MSILLAAIAVLLVVMAVLAIGTAVFSAIAERRNPPIGKFVECQGLRLHYIERGNPTDPPIVVLHGNGSMIQDMTISGLIDLLSNRHRVVCFDRPGFGFSTRTRFRLWTPEAQAELFAEVLPKLRINDPVVLGHSWGTLVALALGLRHDYPIRGVALVSGYYFPTSRLDFWLLSGPAVPVFGDVLRYTLAPVLGLIMLPGILRRLFSPRSVPETFKKSFPFSLALRPKQLRAAAEESAYLIPATARLQFKYQNITCPVRLIHGDADQFIEKEQTARLQRVLSGSVMQLVPEAGHMVHYADANMISRVVSELRF